MVIRGEGLRLGEMGDYGSGITEVIASTIATNYVLANPSASRVSSKLSRPSHQLNDVQTQQTQQTQRHTHRSIGDKDSPKHLRRAQRFISNRTGSILVRAGL